MRLRVPDEIVINQELFDDLDLGRLWGRNGFFSDAFVFLFVDDPLRRFFFARERALDFGELAATTLRVPWLSERATHLASQ
jgi:hypothetical protein